MTIKRFYTDDSKRRLQGSYTKAKRLYHIEKEGKHMQLLKDGMHSLKEEMAVWVALFLTVVFVISLGIIFFFLSTTSMGDPTWGHYAYLLAAMQTVTARAFGG